MKKLIFLIALLAISVDAHADTKLYGTLTLDSYDCTGNASGGKLTTDANGVVSCEDDGGGSGSPGGNDTEIQFNDGGSFAGTAALIWDKVYSALEALTDAEINFTSANWTAISYQDWSSVSNWTAMPNGFIGVDSVEDDIEYKTSTGHFTLWYPFFACSGWASIQAGQYVNTPAPDRDYTVTNAICYQDNGSDDPQFTSGCTLGASPLECDATWDTVSSCAMNATTQLVFTAVNDTHTDDTGKVCIKGYWTD